jgi:hypothetical protein
VPGAATWSVMSFRPDIHSHAPRSPAHALSPSLQKYAPTLNCPNPPGRRNARNPTLGTRRHACRRSNPPTLLSALACAEHALPRLQTFADATESFAHAHYTQNTHHPANPASRSPTRRPLPRARPLWRRKQRPAPARAARKHKSDNIRVIAICETNSRGPVAIRATGRAHFSAKRIPQVAA